MLGLITEVRSLGLRSTVPSHNTRYSPLEPGRAGAGGWLGMSLLCLLLGGEEMGRCGAMNCPGTGHRILMALPSTNSSDYFTFCNLPQAEENKHLKYG